MHHRHRQQNGKNSAAAIKKRLAQEQCRSCCSINGQCDRNAEDREAEDGDERGRHRCIPESILTSEPPSPRQTTLAGSRNVTPYAATNRPAPKFVGYRLSCESTRGNTSRPVR